MASRFTPETREGLLEGFRAGLTLSDACRRVEISEKTVKTWLTRGRKESGTDYAEFAKAVDAGREDAAGAEMDEVEFMSCLNGAVRKGSVQAMKLWWEVNRGRNDDEAEAPADPLTEFDELAERRKRPAA